MSPIPDDLTTVKDDMIAFVEGHGMRRFHGYVDFEEVQCVMWETGGNPDGWKDFVELAKSAGAAFLTMLHVPLLLQNPYGREHGVISQRILLR